MSAEVTAAVERGAEAILNLIFPSRQEQAAAAIGAALDVMEMAVVLFAHEYPGRFWGDAPEWMQAAYVERATALRAHFTGTTS